MEIKFTKLFLIGALPQCWLIDGYFSNGVWNFDFAWEVELVDKIFGGAMIAYVTTIGELTTDLCIWSLEQGGFNVRVIDDKKSSLADKLKIIYNEAKDNFVRVDADVVPNSNLTISALSNAGSEVSWWVQFQTFGWFKQDWVWGGVQYIKKEAIPYLVKNAHKMDGRERPESEMSRLEEFHNPRRFESSPIIMGIQDYKNDIDRVKATKARRNQFNYNFELSQKMYDI